MIAKIRLDQSGATAVEYGLMLALIVLVMFVGLNSVVSSNEAVWVRVRTSVEAVMGG